MLAVYCTASRVPAAQGVSDEDAARVRVTLENAASCDALARKGVLTAQSGRVVLRPYHSESTACMYETTRQERESDAAHANRHSYRMLVGSHHQQSLLSLPYAMYLQVLTLQDAAQVIRSHVLSWLKRREQAASTIAKRALPWLYQPNGPMLRRGMRELGSLLLLESASIS